MRALLVVVVFALVAGCSKAARQDGQADAATAPAAAPDGAGQSVPAVQPASAATPQAGPASLTGTWQGSAEGVSFQLIVQPSGEYSEIQTAGPLMTQQAGVIQATGPSQVTFVVKDWSPKTQPVYHPTGTVGGYNTQEPVAKPIGGVWRVQFTGPNAFSLQDVNLGGIIAFSRVG